MSYYAARPRAETRGVTKSAVIAQHSSSRFITEHYKELRELGRGAFGRVSLVRDLTFDQERVCKVVSTEGMSQPVLEAMRREIELLRSLDHPSIVRLYEYAEDRQKQQLSLILEYIPGGDCWDLLKKASDPLPEELVARLVYQLLAALAYCHLRGVAHRDVKPMNMMIFYPPEGGEPDCKLIDFGLSERGSPEMRDYVGSPKYMAPEIHRRASYTSKADIWSAGVSALELLCGEVQFPRPYEQSIGLCKGVEELEAHLRGLPAWRARGRGARGFVRALLQVDAAGRPAADAALREPWLEAHKPALCKFPLEVARSLASYAGAPAVVRCCLLSIAARVGAPDAQSIGHAFLGADSDGDGLVSHEDLEEALDNMDGYKWWCDPAAQVNVGEVLSSGDLDHHGGLAFTEFLAACLFTRHANMEGFAKLAFDALDSDRDGLIRVQEIQRLFRERDRPFLNSLPQNRPFDLDEWRACVEDLEQDTTVTSSEEDSAQGARGLFGFIACLS